MKGRDSRLKIALVVPGGVDRSGEYRVIPALLALLRQWAPRHELHVFSLAPTSRAESWNFEGVSIHEFGHGPMPLRAVAAIRAVVREHDQAPFHILQALWVGWPGSVAVAAGKWLGIPACIHVAGGEFCALPEIGYGGLLHWPGRTRELFVVRAAAAVSAASQPILDQVASQGVVGRRIPLGVDLAVWPPRLPVRRQTGDPLRLIHVASLNRVKDQHTLLRAMKILAAGGLRFHLDVVGEDTLRGEIQAFATSEGLGELVTFSGFLTHTQLRPLIEAAHLNLISSRHEAGPLVFLEAAVAGVPSVSTAVGHPCEWAPDAAWCVPVGDSAAFAAAVAALSADEDRRLRIATEAQRRALVVDAAHTATLLEALYAEVLPP